MTTRTKARWLGFPVVAAATVRLLAACGGNVVAGVDSHDAGDGGPPSSVLDARVPETGPDYDALQYDSSSGESIDASTTGNGVCDPSVAWAQMLAAPIAPPTKAANLDLWDYGEVTLAYAESVNCALVRYPADSGMSRWAYGYWGPDQDVVVSTDPSGTRVTTLLLQGSYTGTIQFQSIAGSFFGAHTYVIGLGILERDGAPFPIDPSTPQPAVSEIYEGLRETFAPYITPKQNCFDEAVDCIWGQAGATGDPSTAYYFTIPQLSLTVLLGTVAQGMPPQGIQVSARQPADAGADGG